MAKILLQFDINTADGVASLDKIKAARLIRACARVRERMSNSSTSHYFTAT